MKEYGFRDYQRDIVFLESAEALNQGSFIHEAQMIEKMRDIMSQAGRGIMLRGGSIGVANEAPHYQVRKVFDTYVGRTKIDVKFFEEKHPELKKTIQRLSPDHNARETLNALEDALNNNRVDEIETLAHQFAVQTEKFEENHPLVLRYDSRVRPFVEAYSSQ